jgi:hypothetical protein
MRAYVDHPPITYGKKQNQTARVGIDIPALCQFSTIRQKAVRMPHAVTGLNYPARTGGLVSVRQGWEEQDRHLTTSKAI